MGTSLDTRPAPETTRLPGDFHRHAYTGAPMVPDPNRQNKIKGKKADLIELCKQHDIEVPSKVTVKELIALLEAAGVGGPAPMVQYGRPSSFGKQIENSTNLQKWSERMVGWGVALMAISGTDFTGLDAVNPELDEDRSMLDGLAVEAKRYAKADLAAERGTHTHELTEDRDEGRDPIERMRAGEGLGLPVEVQNACLAAWDLMQSQDYFEVLEVEAKGVDDRWRLAGTMDRIVRLKRDITFYCFGGEVVTLKAGTVLILDIKTGQLRLTPKGEPMYWHGYAIQVASYAQSVPFDPDTGVRGEWPFEIDQKYAIIAHLDVLAALDGEAVCRLILVDIEAGRAAGDLVVAAKAWERRKDVFSIIGASPDEVVFTVPVEAPAEAPAETPETPAPAPGPFEVPVWSQRWGPSSESTPATPKETPCPSISSAPATSSLSEAPNPSPVFPPIIPPSVDGASSTSSESSSTVSGTTASTTAPASTPTPSPIPVFPPIGITNPAPSTGSTDSTNSASPTPTTPSDSTTATATAPTPDQLAETLGAEVVDYAQQHAEDLKALAHEIAEWPEHVRAGLARAWPDPNVLPYPATVRNGEAEWTADQMPLIRTLLAAAGAPFTAANADPVPPRETAFLTAPERHADLEPVERPTLEILTDAVRESGQVERINRWLTEAHQAGVAFSPLAMPNVGNYERLRFALRLAEFAEDDFDLQFILCSDEPITDTPIGELIGRMTGAEAQTAVNRIEALSTGRSALLYTDDGAPRIVDSISA